MSASQIHILRLKSNAFVANINHTIEKIVNNNEDLKLLNQKQLKSSLLADGSPMKHPLSPAYAAWKSQYYPSSFGDGNPNWFLTGSLFKQMTIKAKGEKYKVTSSAPYAANLINRFGDGFGIAPYNHPAAQNITTRLLLVEYKAKVL